MEQSTPPFLRPILALLASLTGRKAFQQNATEVFVREPGERLLEGPRPVAAEAKKDWEFAWLSEAAYAGSLEETKKYAAPPEAPINQTFLNEGWTRWTNFPNDGIAKRIRKSNLRFEVWEKKDPPCVAVAFGGTVFTSGKDWKSNLRWFLPHHKDEYTEIVEVFGPAFVDEFVSRTQTTEGAHLSQAELFSTGHSLGGGLAQQFAYALPVDNPVPRIKRVYAFDPSPVTGFYSVTKLTRDRNKRGLSIDRIYERGEILAILRSLTSFLFPPSAEDPQIRAVRYSLFYPANPITGHSIRQFASKLQDKAGFASLAQLEQ